MRIPTEWPATLNTAPVQATSSRLVEQQGAVGVIRAKHKGYKLVTVVHGLRHE